MATYVELRQLFSNSSLSNRIEVACVIAANIVRTEDAGTDNHANRITWAKQTFGSPGSMASKMLMYLLAANKDLTAVQLVGVSDEDLQTAVNAAVNLFADGS